MTTAPIYTNAELAEDVLRQLATDSPDDSVRLNAALTLRSDRCPSCAQPLPKDDGSEQSN